MNVPTRTETFAMMGTLLVAGLLCRTVISQLLARARARLLDVPNERSSHRVATPRGGGLGIAIAALTGWLVWGIRAGAPSGWMWVAAAAAVIAGVGFADDFLSLSARNRLFFQLACAAVAVWCLGPFRELELPWSVRLSLGPLAGVLTVIWIAGLTNAFNFMDGIDGIAGVQGLASTLAYAFLAQRLGLHWAAGLCMALTGALLAFLKLNWHPAKIFMGDVGSTLLGYIFAVLPLALAPSGSHAVAPLAALLIVWPFVFDAGFTFTRRLLRRENVFAPHRTHLYQRLVISGLKHSTVSALYGLLALCCAAAGVWLHAREDFLPAAFALLVVPVGLLAWVAKRESK